MERQEALTSMTIILARYRAYNKVATTQEVEACAVECATLLNATLGERLAATLEVCKRLGSKDRT